MAVDQPLEREISEFLRQDSTIDAMVDASDRGRPAVEAIDTELLQRFGNRVRPVPARQRIGRLVRPIGISAFSTSPVHGRPAPRVA